MNWICLCRRTEDPKLAYLEYILTRRAIPHKREGESWHAPVLVVPAAFEELAWGVLAQPARSYGLRTRHGVSLDDVPDSHRDFRGYQPSDYIPECDGAPPCGECAACNEREDPNDYRGMGRIGRSAMNHDPELPGGYQDDDFDMRDLEQAGARSAALRRRGICDHGWLMAPDGEPARCLHCGAVFANAEAAYEARREARS